MSTPAPLTDPTPANPTPEPAMMPVCDIAAELGISRARAHQLLMTAQMRVRLIGMLIDRGVPRWQAAATVCGIPSRHLQCPSSFAGFAAATALQGGENIAVPDFPPGGKSSSNAEAPASGRTEQAK